MMASSPRISPPVLMYDGSRMDWDEASYSVDVTVSSGATDVVHRLSGCPELDRLLEAGFAKYAVEVRCPRELRSTTEISDEPQQRVTAGSRRDGEFLVPGIIAVSDSRIGAEGLHWHIRQFCDGVDVPAGWWLARAAEYRTMPLSASLLKFVRDSDGLLGSGMMSVEEDAKVDAPQFRVILAEDLYDNRRYDRDVQIAALMAAFGILPSSSMAPGNQNAESPVATMLRDRLLSAGLPAWDDPSFDPARAATLLECFRVYPPDTE